jgi:hypothetical protein
MKLSGEAIWTLIWLIVTQMFSALSTGESFSINTTVPVVVPEEDDPDEPEDFEADSEVKGVIGLSADVGELQEFQKNMTRTKNVKNKILVFFISFAPCLLFSRNKKP